jgi:hypothetical protein
MFSPPHSPRRFIQKRLIKTRLIKDCQVRKEIGNTNPKDHQIPTKQNGPEIVFSASSFAFASFAIFA